MKHHGQKGFSAIITIVILIVVAGIAFGGWYVWKQNQKDDPTKSSKKTTQTEEKNDKKPSDPSEGGKYLVIKEWGVRFELPQDLRNDVGYSLGGVVADPDENHIQAAKLLLRIESGSENNCAIIVNSGTAFIETGAQILRTEGDKPFNTSRYRWTFKEDILMHDSYAYHANYVTPECANGYAATEIEQLQTVLEQLQPLN